MAKKDELKKDFEEQYELLKEEEEREEKKKVILLIVVCSITLLISIFGATFSYYNTRIKGNKDDSKVVENGRAFNVVFLSNNNIKIENINAGWKSNIKFNIKNTGDTEIPYKISWTDVTNTFKDQELVATLKKDNQVIFSKKTLPQKDGALFDDISVAKGQTHNYELSIEYTKSEDSLLSENNQKFQSTIQIVAK